MTLKWGFSSGGRIANDFSRTLGAILDEGHEKTAVAEVSSEKAEAFAKEHGFKRSYGSCQLLAEDNEINIAYVCANNSQHLQLVKLFLNAGKHVLCEKPMTESYEETEELTKLGKEKNLFLMEGHWSRCSPIYRKLLSVVKSNELGEARQVYAHFHVPGIRTDAMWELGCYCVSFADLIFESEPVEIKSIGVKNAKSLTSLVQAVLRFPGDKTATISCGSETTRPNTACVSFDKGFFEIKTFMHAPTDYEYSEGFWKGQKSTQCNVPLPGLPEADYMYPNGQGLAHEIRHVKECIDSGLIESPIVPHATSLRLVKIIQGIFNSM